MSEKHWHQTRVSFYICHWGGKEGRKGFFTTPTWKDGWEERKKEISFIFFCFCFMSNETLLVSSVSAITCPHLSSIEELWLGFILKENRVIRYFLLVFIWNIVRFDELKNPRLSKKLFNPSSPEWFIIHFLNFRIQPFYDFFVSSVNVLSYTKEHLFTYLYFNFKKLSFTFDIATY